ncbi:MAG: four helix bundle protein [Bacteroidota bacterium]|nr:four helix bundle protein [Bacteroidota bacterium]
MDLVTSSRELKVYKVAYKAAMEVFLLTKTFPEVEKFDLTSQIRRLSRSVVSNIVEAWRRRRYPKNFVSKLTESETEADETLLWLNMSLDCNYISIEEHARLSDKYDYILSMLVLMIKDKDKWCF